MRRRVILFFCAVLLLVAAFWWWRSAHQQNVADNQKLNWPQTAAQRANCRDSIFGRVLDGDQQPVASALLRLGEKQTRTDDQGRFVLRALKQTEHNLDCERAGFVVAGPPGQQNARISLPRRDDGEQGCIFDLELHMHRPAFVQGQVLKSGKPQQAELDLLVLKAQGLQKSLGPYALEQVQKTDAQGHFRFALTPGLVQIVASAGDQGEAQSDELLLHDAEHLDDIVIDLDQSDQPAEPGLSGLVQNEQGQMIAGAELLLTGASLAQDLRQRSDGQGHFLFSDLHLDQPQAQLQIFVRAQGYHSKIRTISVSSSQNKALRIILRKGTGIFGRVLDAQGHPASRAYVIVRLGRRPKLLRSNAQGFFQWQQAAALRGTGERAANGQGEAWAISPFAADSKQQVIKTGEECLLRLGPGAALGGQVVNDRGQPLKDFRVAIERIEVEGARPYRSNVYPIFRPAQDASEQAQAGAFRFAALRPGRYLLAASAENFATTRTDWLELKSGEDYSGLRIVLRSGGAVYGQVTNSDGDAVAGAQLRLSEFRSAFKAQTVKTDSEGRYRLEHLEAGRKSLRVSARSYMTQVAAGVEVPEQGELRRDVTLARARPGADFSFAGIGAVLMRSRGGVYIREVMPGQGAAAQGLRHGDKIVSVDGDDVDGLDLGQVVSKIRGEEGEGVSLDIERPGVGPISVEVERGQVVVEQRPSPHRRRKK